MRKNGWQLPYHPLQVVAVAVFLALGFAFYVFFAPFVGKQLFQYIVMGIYSPLIICSFGLYIWCAASDPADPGVFRSKKYLNIPNNKKHFKQSGSKRAGDSISSIQDANTVAAEEEANVKNKNNNASIGSTEPDNTNTLHQRSCTMAMLALLPCAYVCNSHDQSSQHMSEDGMFYCSLCEVEVFKYSKHCRVCDKCVDRFDHHCRWLNNCIGKRNYRKFFALMVSAILLLILQCSTGILVLILCFLERKRFATDISSKLGSSFTVVPYVIVVAVCTILAMIATLPLAQLFFFHILLIKKGISTYDYIIALREQDQQAGGGQQSPQMSPASSLTRLSSASSLNTFHRATWCTPPRLFVEDQYDVVPPDNGSVSSLGKKTMAPEEPTKRKNPPAVKISPWTLARLNAEDISKAAAEARKKSKIMRPVVRRDNSNYAPETDSSVGSSGRRMALLMPQINRKRGSKRIRLPADVPLEPVLKVTDAKGNRDHRGTSTSLGPLQLEAQSGFRAGGDMLGQLGSPDTATSSPQSSMDSPDAHPLRVSSSGPEDPRRFGSSMAALNEFPLSRSTSDGYEASGGEDSDIVVPPRIIHRSTNWSSILFGSEQPHYMPPSSSSNHRML